MADMKVKFMPEDRISLKVSVHTLQVFHMPTVGDSADIDPNPAPAINLSTFDGEYQRLRMLNALSQLC